MYAVIMTGGKQYRVEEGEVLRVEKLQVDEGANFDFDKVLMVGQGEDVQVGSPVLDGARVSATVRSHGRGDKVHIIKFHRRKNYMRRQGHRQSYTEIEVTGIAAG